MASKMRYPVRAPQREAQLLSTEVTFGSSGAPTLTDANCGFTISRDSAGLYTITFDDKVASVTGVCILRGDGASLTDKNWQSWARFSSNTIKIQHVDAILRT